MKPTVLTMPGINNSGSTHWQTIWENRFPEFRRIQVDDWDRPDSAAWSAAIQRAVDNTHGPIIFVAHSLGCLSVIDWVMHNNLPRIIGGLFVAVPDPQGPNFPVEAVGFTPPQRIPLPFKSIVVASTNDPYGPMAYARQCAQAWGGELVDAGALGHINASSNLGYWEQGLALLQLLREYGPTAASK